MHNEFIQNTELKNLTIKELIKISGGWIEGHITFENGEHGNGYIDNLQFLKHPKIMDEISFRMAKEFEYLKGKIDFVAGPSIIGAIIAYAVARHLEVPFTTTYSDYKTGKLTFHRGFFPNPGMKGIFVDDCIFSGGCVIKNVDFMQSVGLKVMGVATATTRLSLKIKDVPVKSLYQVEFVKINENNCQLCLLNKPIVARNIRE